MSISFIDPPHVRHLGEFASLKKMILGHFDGDSSLRFHTDEDRWQAIARHYSAEQRALIVAQIHELVCREDAYVLALWDRHSDYFRFETPEQLRAYLEQRSVLLE